MNTATIVDLALASDGVVLVTADCDRCRRTVMHAAGTDLAALNLGHRISHCGCPDGYELIDDGIVRLRLRGLYVELANRQADQARRAALKAHRAALMELEPLR